MRFEFSSVPQIVFGPGTLAEAGRLASNWGKRALVVGNMPRVARLVALLESSGIAPALFQIRGEPTIATIAAGIDAARAHGATQIIAFGGGSAIDTAKAIAGLLPNPGNPLEYLEVVGRGAPLTEPPLPWMAIPTTAGTGAEVTRNAVLGVPDRRVKVSLRSPLLFARVALVDPELALDLPPATTAATAMDALTQLLEAYVCVRANPHTDALCAAGLARLAQALPQVWQEPRSLAARTDLALASLWSGQALTNAGLGAVHGFAAPIGGMFPAPHGAICAALLAPVMAANVQALRSRAPQHPSLQRYRDVAGWLTRQAGASAEEGIAWVHAQATTMRIPRLSAYGILESSVGEIVSRAQQASSMKANPITLTSAELASTLRQAM